MRTSTGRGAQGPKRKLERFTLRRAHEDIRQGSAFNVRTCLCRLRFRGSIRRTAMKTRVIDVGGIISPLSATGVERMLRRLPGLHRAEVNAVAGSATVEYDDKRIALPDIRQAVVDCGHHCRGERVPRHLCVPSSVPGGHLDAHALAHTGSHTEHATRAAAAQVPTSVSTVERPRVPEMAHDMGHGAGMDMQAMVRDMRNRLLVALVFAVPLF